MSLRLINESFDKMYQEAISPEAKADSDKLRQLLNNHRNDWYDNSTKPLSKEEQDALDKHSLKYDEQDRTIYPNEYEVDHDNYNRRDFGIDAERYRFYNKNQNVDLTQLSRKHLQRANAKTANPSHGTNRTSDEKQRLQQAVKDAKDDLAVYNKHGWKDDAKSAERSLKIRQGKLDKENQRLKDLRRKRTYQDMERELHAKDMGKNLRALKDTKSYLKYADTLDNDIRNSREYETRRFMDTMKDLDKRAERVEQERQASKDYIDRLLRRKK